MATAKTAQKAKMHKVGARKNALGATKGKPEGKDQHPGGRPTDYRPEMCAEVVRLGKGGKSYTQIAEALDLSRETLYAWAKDKPEFSDALTRARQAAQAWWENAGQTGLVTPGFSASLWQKNVSCRFPDDWREVTRQESTGKDGGPIQQHHKMDVKLSAEDSYKQMLGG